MMTTSNRSFRWTSQDIPLIMAHEGRDRDGSRLCPSNFAIIYDQLNRARVLLVMGAKCRFFHGLLRPSGSRTLFVSFRSLASSCRWIVAIFRDLPAVPMLNRRQNCQLCGYPSGWRGIGHARSAMGLEYLISGAK